MAEPSERRDCVFAIPTGACGDDEDGVCLRFGDDTQRPVAAAAAITQRQHRKDITMGPGIY